MYNQKPFTLWRKRAFNVVRLEKCRLYGVVVTRIPTTARVEIVQLLLLWSVFQQMNDLYHLCISTRGRGIFQNAMLPCMAKSNHHLHGQLQAGLTMNWDWNVWNRTLKNILLRCLYHESDLLLILTVTVESASHVF
jgi:hypothetical protein